MKAAQAVEKAVLEVLAKTSQEAVVNYSLLNTLDIENEDISNGKTHLSTKQ